MATQASWLVGVFGVIIAIIFGIKSRQADGRGERGVSMGEVEGRNYLQHGKEEVRRGVEIPRLTLEQYESRYDQVSFPPHPVVITGALDTWHALKRWKRIGRLVDLYPQAVAEFYPTNMLTHVPPYLTQIERGIFELRRYYSRKFREKHPETKFPIDWKAIKGRYLHIQISPEMWSHSENEEDISQERPDILHGDGWMDTCLPDSEGLKSEFHIKTHWKVVFVGTRGSGMFNHSDSLLTSSYHAHIRGSKWWYVCSPKLQAVPSCYESVVSPGEVLLYGSGWTHETQNLNNPTITVTGTRVDAHNFKSVASRLYHECATGELGLGFSSELCDALDHCYVRWLETFGGVSKAERRKHRSWRQVSSASIIAQREAQSPNLNNYNNGKNIIIG